MERGASVHGALRPFLPRLYRLAARGHWLAEQRPIRRERRPWERSERLQSHVPAVTADDFALSSVVSDEGELYTDLKLTRLGISFSLGPYPHIREFTKMFAARLAPGSCWQGQYCQAGGDAGAKLINGESAFQFWTNGVRVWLTPKERAAVESLFKQAMHLPQLQTTLAQLALEYGEV